MKNYLKTRIGEKLGIVRIGIPQEVYFEAKLKETTDEVAIFEDEHGRTFALGIERIVLVGPPEKSPESSRNRPGFSPVKEKEAKK